MVVEHIDGSPFLHDMDIKRALRNKVFLSLPEITCTMVRWRLRLVSLGQLQIGQFNFRC